MDHKHSGLLVKPALPPFPPADFSVPPPVIQDNVKIKATTTIVEKPKEISRNAERQGSSSRYESNSSARNRESSRYSSQASSSRDNRSQSRFSTSARPMSRNDSREQSSRRPNDSSRDSSRKHDPARDSSRRNEDTNRDNYRRKRSRSRSASRQSSRRSPVHRSSSSRRSPYKSRPSSSRNSPKRDSRRSREPSRHTAKSPKEPQTERERLLVKFRKNYCETSEQISRKLLEMGQNEEQASWIRSSPADIHYKRAKDVIESTPRLDALCTLFDEELLKRAEKKKSAQAPYNAPNRRRNVRVCRHKSESTRTFFPYFN